MAMQVQCNCQPVFHPIRHPRQAKVQKQVQAQLQGETRALMPHCQEELLLVRSPRAEQQSLTRQMTCIGCLKIRGVCLVLQVLLQGPQQL